MRTGFIRPEDPVPPGVKVLWRPHPGPQTDALLAQEDELLLGGSKGGGKTAAGIAWLISGNPYSDHSKLADHSYINHPHYRALVLRRNMIDMGDWVDKAKRIFEPLGGTFRERPLAVFEFRSGAKIVLGHLDDSDTYSKYQGQEFQRFLLEEATLVPDLMSYLMVVSCIRSVYPELRAQTFLTANPGGPGHCVPFGDVLTPSGWVDIREMKIGDPVFTVDPACGQLTESVVEQTHRSHYSGEMVRATARGFHVECTPSHGIAKTGGLRDADRGKHKFTVVPFENLPSQATAHRSMWWSGGQIADSDVEIPRLPGRRKHSQPLKLEGREYGALLGWFISEGCLVDRDGAFQIAQMKADGRCRIAELLRRCGFTFSESSTGFTIYSPEWYSHLKSLGLGKSWEKFIPPSLKRAHQVVLRHLFDALVDGDGHWNTARGAGGCYYTSSSKLADDVAEVALKIGYIVFQSSRQREDRETRAYEVSFKTTKSGGTELLTGQHVYEVETETGRRSEIDRFQFDGEVYCIGVPNTHTFVIRQNGCVWISGNSWVRDRFIKPKDSKGRIVPPNTPIVDPETGLKRIFIPAKLHDNPALMADPNYQKRLMQLPDAQRRAFLDGDWDALSGVFFTEFRPTGPLIGEPLEARHVIPPRVLAPWLHRLIGMDWGYAHDGAAYWGCENSDGRFHVYREMVEKNLGAEKWGAEIALRSLDDLRGVDGGSMSLYLSPDAWDKRSDQRSIADQIAAGIRVVLGPDSVLLAGGESDGEDAGFFRRLEDQKRFGIAVRKAPNQRIAGAQYIRSQLRWWPLTKVEEQQKFDQDMFMRLLHADPKRAMEYREAFYRQQKADVLPGLLIHDTCPRLIDGLQSVLHDERNPEDVEKRDGDDCYDAFRYLVFARSKEKVREPESVFVERRMQAMAQAHGGELDGNTKVWVARKAEADYRQADTTEAIFNIPRLSSRRGKMMTN